MIIIQAHANAIYFRSNAPNIIYLLYLLIPSPIAHLGHHHHTVSTIHLS